MEGYVGGEVRDELFTITVVVDSCSGYLTEKLGRGVKCAEVSPSGRWEYNNTLQFPRMTSTATGGMGEEHWMRWDGENCGASPEEDALNS